MTHRLDDKWIWDFWFARDAIDYHVFYLQASRSLGNPNLRHWNASIGHAISRDLLNWAVLPDALVPSSHEDAWDNFTVWTGSTIQHNGTWYMFYTGTNRAEKGLIQRIGLATSDDLVIWKRFSGNPILKSDPRWYEMLNLDVWHEQAWRDPWVFKYNGTFHALITARINYGHKSSRGVIGYASSPDLLNWDIQAPITEPGEFGNMEVPQIVQIKDRWFIFFSVEYDKFSELRIKRHGVKHQTGTHYLVSDNPFGPYKYFSDDFLFGDEIGSIYSGKVIQNPRSEWVFMGCNQYAPGNSYIGEISDPAQIYIRPSGQITVPQ